MRLSHFSPASLRAAFLSVALVGIAALATPAAHAQTLFTEDFENVTALQTGGAWSFQNLSTSANPTGLWRQGSNAANSIGPAPSGTATSYALANFTDTSSTASTGATISNWMITPVLTYVNGSTVSFFTRTGTGAAFPDRLEVRFSAAGSSTNVGATPTSVGDFTTTLLTINPNLATGAANYPDTWTQFTVNIAGLTGATPGRIAFRYFVTNAGSAGANSNIIGVDTLRITIPGGSAAPEPGSVALMAMGALPLVGLIARRRKSA